MTRALRSQRGLAPGDLARLILVTFLWALCFPLIAVGLSAASPLNFAALRSFVAGAGLLLPAFALRRPLPRDWHVWLGLLGVGLSATSLGFGGMFLAGRAVSPGVATVLANTQPLIAAGLAYFALDERLGSRRRVGLLLGFVGVVLVALPGIAVENANSTPMGVGYVLFGALGLALGNVLLKRLTGQVDLLMASGWQFILGGVPLLLAAWLFEAPARVTWSLRFIADLLALGLIGTALAFTLWFSLLHRGELTRLNIFTFLTAIFALTIGALFFRERLSWEEISGIVLTLIGVAWVTRTRRLQAESGEHHRRGDPRDPTDRFRDAPAVLTIDDRFLYDSGEWPLPLTMPRSSVRMQVMPTPGGMGRPHRRRTRRNTSSPATNTSTAAIIEAPLSLRRGRVSHGTPLPSPPAMSAAEPSRPAKGADTMREPKSHSVGKEEVKHQILSRRREIILQLEEERGSRVITLIHRKEPWLAEEEEQSIAIEDSEHVLMEIHRTPKDRPIDIVINTPGGLQLAAEMIGAALKQHPAQVTAIVPFYAMSGGTLIALAADEILMEEFSVLGPLDPQIGGVAAGSLLGIMARKNIDAIADETIALADLAEKALVEVKGYIAWFLGDKALEEEQRTLIAEFLTGGYVAHARPLSLASLARLGLPVRTGVPDLVWELFSTCTFGHCERPGPACGADCCYH